MYMIFKMFFLWTYIYEVLLNSLLQSMGIDQWWSQKFSKPKAQLIECI